MKLKVEEWKNCVKLSIEPVYVNLFANHKVLNNCDHIFKQLRFTLLTDLLFKFYQNSHFLFGFMRESIGQLNAFAKSGKFDKTPIVRKLSGVCSSVKNNFSLYFGVDLRHKKLTEVIQNICSGV